MVKLCTFVFAGTDDPDVSQSNQSCCDPLAVTLATSVYYDGDDDIAGACDATLPTLSKCL